MFVWGGNAGSVGQHHSRLDMFGVNMLTEEWHQHDVTPPDTPPPCERSCSAAIGNTIYSYGGVISFQPFRTSDELYKLNLDVMRWRRVTTRDTKPEGRCGAGMCSMNGRLLLMGGHGPLPSQMKHPRAEYKKGGLGEGCGWNNELFEFDPKTGCWSPVCVCGSQPSQRAHHTLTAVDKKRAILFGGYDGEKQLNDVWLFDDERKVWLYITPTSPLWPQPMNSHTVCTMVSNNEEIKVLLLGGHSRSGKVLSDCWLLDVLRGIGEKVMFDGETLSRRGHSAGCVTLSNGTVVVSVVGGCTTSSLSSVVSNPCFYQWEPRHPSELQSGLAPAGTVLRADPRVSEESLSPTGTSEEMGRLKEVYRLAEIPEQQQQQGQLDQTNAQLIEERTRVNGLEEEKRHANKAGSVAEGKVRLEFEAMRSQISQLSVANAQLTGEVRKLKEDKQSLQQEFSRLSEETKSKETQLHHKQMIIDTLCHESDERQRAMEQMTVEKGELEQRIDEVEQLLRNAEAGSEAAERRLRDGQQVLNIPAQHIQLSDKELGAGAYGVIRLGYWRGCPVAVKTLHESLAKEHYQRRVFEQEVSVISRLHHPNIAAICGVIQQPDAPFSLIMELLQASLADVIEAAHVSGKYLTLREQTDVSRDCLSGLTYLHDLPCCVLHGDICPRNILITSVMRAKLGDLGAARFTDGSLSTGPMSPLYVAPERLGNSSFPNSKEADIYSMGVSLAELFTGDQMNREDRPRQLRSVGQKDLRLVCVKMACDNVAERMMASVALTVNDRVVKKNDYNKCGPRRMVKGVADGVDKVTLCDKPW